MKREQLAAMAVSPYGSWPRDEAEAFVVLSSASLPMAQALHERSTVLRNAPPALGQHTDEVLRELGLDAERIAALRAAKAI